jgi:hypothetical protein
MSAIALFVSLGGVGYAATTIGSAQIKDNSVASRDIKDGTIQTKDIAKRTISSLRGRRGATGAVGLTGPMGPPGPTGATGATGAPGTALAFARVNFDGTVDTSRSKNVADVNVTHPSVGVYCFDGLGFTPKNVVATPESGDRTINVFGLIDDAAGCPGIDEDFLIATRDLSMTLTDTPFYVLVN